MVYTEEDLKNKVRDLEKQTDKNLIVSKLQEIGKFILQNCYFEFEEGKKCYPLWIEAYYYNKGRFEDINCHQHPEQKGEKRFGLPYYHGDGIDICLPLGNYYLSYLIKVSYDENGKIHSQSELCNSISIEKRKTDEVVFLRIMIEKLIIIIA